MREIIAESQPFVRDELPADKAREVFAGPPLQARDHRRRQHRPDVGDVGVGVGPHLREPAEAAEGRAALRRLPGFIDLCRGPHVPNTGLPPRPLQADARRRRVLARRRGQPAAAAHLRHGVGLEEGARGAPPPPRGGRQARPPQARRRARPVQLPRRDRLRPRRVPPQGRPRPPAHGGLLAPAPRARRATSSSTRRTSRRPTLFETSGHLDWFADGMFPPMHFDDEGGEARPGLLPEADELPVPHPDLQVAAAELPRAAAADVRVRHGVPLREVRRGPRAHAGARHDAGRRPHLLHEGADGRASSPRCSTSCSACCATTGSSDFYLELSTKPPGKAVGTDEEWEEATEALRAVASSKDLELVLDEGGGAFYGPKISVQARDAIGRTLADVDDPGRLPAAAALRAGVRRRRQRAAPADHDPPRAVRIDRAVLRACSSSTTPARSRRGWRRCRCGCCRSAATTTPTPIASSTGCRPTGSGPTLVEADEPLGGAHPQGQAREAAVHPRGRRQRRRGRHGRRQRRGAATSPSATSTSTPSSTGSPPRSRPRRDSMPLDHLWADVAVGVRRQGRSTRARSRRPRRPPAGRCSSGSWRGADEEGDEAASVLWRGAHVLRAPEPVPLHRGPPAWCCRSRRWPSSRTCTDDEHAELWAAVRDAVVALKAAFRATG